MLISPPSTIPYVDLKSQWQSEREELLPIIEKILASGNYIGGRVVDDFEAAVAKFCGTEFCVALNSGTDALALSLAALEVGPGDEVITQPNSFVASAGSIKQVGAKPVFVDVDEYQQMDPSKIESVISSKTKAIMPVHLTGRIGDISRIKRIAEDYQLPLVEDAAQSIGSMFRKRKSGTFGRVGCFSAHPLKNLNACGDAGFVVTDDQKVAEYIKKARNHGMIDRDTVVSFGAVSRMDSIQAGILNYRLNKIEDIIRTRQRNADLYRQTLDENFVFYPDVRPDYEDTYHTFVIQVDERDALAKHLQENGVGTAIHYPTPIHLQQAAQFLGFKRGDFPNAENQAKRIISLPINQNLSVDQIQYIAERVNEFYIQN